MLYEFAYDTYGTFYLFCKEWIGRSNLSTQLKGHAVTEVTSTQVPILI